MWSKPCPSDVQVFHAHPRSRLLWGCGHRGPPLWHHQSARAHPREDLTTAVHDGSHDTRAAVCPPPGSVTCQQPGTGPALSSENDVKLKTRRCRDLLWTQDFNHLWLDMKDFPLGFPKQSVIEQILFSLAIDRKLNCIWFPCRLWDNSCGRAKEEQEPQLFNHFKSVKKLTMLLHVSDTDSCDPQTWELQILIHHI